MFLSSSTLKVPAFNDALFRNPLPELSVIGARFTLLLSAKRGWRTGYSKPQIFRVGWFGVQKPKLKAIQQFWSHESLVLIHSKDRILINIVRVWTFWETTLTKHGNPRDDAILWGHFGRTPSWGGFSASVNRAIFPHKAAKQIYSRTNIHTLHTHIWHICCIS